MTRISTFCVFRSALLIVLLVFGLAPLMSAPAEAEHGGGGGAPSHSSGNATPGKATPGKTTPEIAIPQPVAPQPPPRLQGIQFQPDSRCAQLTAAQRRQTPGCGYN